MKKSDLNQIADLLDKKLINFVAKKDLKQFSMKNDLIAADNRVVVCVNRNFIKNDKAQRVIFKKLDCAETRLDGIDIKLDRIDAILEDVSDVLLPKSVS